MWKTNQTQKAKAFKNEVPCCHGQVGKIVFSDDIHCQWDTGRASNGNNLPVKQSGDIYCELFKSPIDCIIKVLLIFLRETLGKNVYKYIFKDHVTKLKNIFHTYPSLASLLLLFQRGFYQDSQDVLLDSSLVSFQWILHAATRTSFLKHSQCYFLQWWESPVW